jgi:hypothetical protein
VCVHVDRTTTPSEYELDEVEGEAAEPVAMGNVHRA